ncbi:MAG: hypothetical protein LBT05_16880, partial [Planctomycetaceae bacterium]|nr:hypothetical protein [Planctomycetaceae bacterium]
RIHSGFPNKVTVECVGINEKWEIAAIADFQVKENEMHLAVPRRLLEVQKQPLRLQFKWADNTLSDEKIESFYIDGDVAPIGRLNYVFTE